MDLKEKIIKTEKREVSGARAANRFTYQLHWAFMKLLELFETDKDFMLVMEHHDDVIILDSAQDPKFIDFYQVKTNTKKGVQYISSSTLTNREKNKGKTEDSFMEKLIDDYSRFRNETKSLHFVSNKGFNLKLVSDEDSRDKPVIRLEHLTGLEFNKFKANMCEKCGLNDCKQQCKKIIYFDVSDLDVNNYTETVIGKLLNFLDKYGQGTIRDSKSVYNTLVSEIMRINNTEKKAESFDELIKLKSITKERFRTYIDQFKQSGLMLSNWTEISNDLRNENYTAMQILRIRKQWNRFRVDMLGNMDKTLNIIREDISDILLKAPQMATYREYIDHVHDQITTKEYYDSGLYDRDYYTAIVLAELNYEEI